MEGIDRGDERGFAGGPPSGESCGDKARKACEEEARWIDDNFLHGEQDIVGGDGGGDGVEKSAGDLEAEEDSERGANKS